MPLKKDSEPIFTLDNLSSYITNLVRINFNEILKVVLSLPFANLSIKHSIGSNSLLKWDSNELNQATFLLNSIMNLYLDEKTPVNFQATSSGINPFSSLYPFTIVFSLVPNIPFASRITDWESLFEPIVASLSLLNFYVNLENFHSLRQHVGPTGMIRNNSSLNSLKEQIDILKTSYTKILLALSLSLVHYDDSVTFNFSNFTSFFLSFNTIQLLVSPTLLNQTYQEISACLKYFTNISNNNNLKSTMKMRQKEFKDYILNSKSQMWDRISSNVTKSIQEEINIDLGESTISIIKEATRLVPCHLSMIILEFISKNV